MNTSEQIFKKQNITITSRKVNKNWIKRIKMNTHFTHIKNPEGNKIKRGKCILL